MSPLHPPIPSLLRPLLPGNSHIDFTTTRSRLSPSHRRPPSSRHLPPPPPEALISLPAQAPPVPVDRLKTAQQSWWTALSPSRSSSRSARPPSALSPSPATTRRSTIRFPRSLALLTIILMLLPASLTAHGARHPAWVNRLCDPHPRVGPVRLRARGGQRRQAGRHYRHGRPEQRRAPPHQRRERHHARRRQGHRPARSVHSLPPSSPPTSTS